MKNDIRLIAMDMDGTLLNSDSVISYENLKALHEAREAGIRLAICSGRCPGDIALYAEESGLTDCAILSLNGTYCKLSAKAKPFADHVFRADTLTATREILDKAQVPYGCFAENEFVIIDRSDVVASDFWVGHTGGPSAPTFSYGYPELARLDRHGVNKILALFPDQASVSLAQAALCTVNGLYVTSSFANDLELMPTGYDKGSAVMELAAYLGIQPAQVMTFGDYDNDLSMITRAGFGTAMGNATALIKNAAKFQTKTNNEDGIAWAIQEYVFD